jgi:hypothetical protein
MNFCVDCKHCAYHQGDFFCIHGSFANPVTKAGTPCKEIRESKRKSDMAYIECKQFEAKE